VRGKSLHPPVAAGRDAGRPWLSPRLQLGRGSKMTAIADNFRTIWLSPDDPGIVQIIDQTQLPHDYVLRDLSNYRQGVHAISEMLVRGAPLIGATAAWSLYLAAIEGSETADPAAFVKRAALELGDTRPTAVNLRWALDRMLSVMRQTPADQDLVSVLRSEAEAICDEDIGISWNIGLHGCALIEEIAKSKRGEPVNILTHCNAGALATINWGTATAPVYVARQRGIDVHVWVDETRPRNQGSQLTCWELARNRVPHTLIVDNAGGHLMQQGQVDICITGTDRTTRSGDVVNKIGTYLKALAARDNGVPFYVALPSTTIDWTVREGLADIPIEERDASEVSHIRGMLGDDIREIKTVADGTPIRNFAFDVTPARIISGLITERGICNASEGGLSRLFPELAKRAS
jgi:methylthioribose-1-phosphate isomerase